MFELKKFVGLIAIENRLMQLFYDKAEAIGLNPTFDIFHIMENKETPKDLEIAIMKEIYMNNIRGTELEKIYNTADSDFFKNIAERNRKLSNLKQKNSFTDN